MIGKKEINITKNPHGFTLVEVMIALAIFAIFSTVFVSSQGYNLTDSINLREGIILRDLCEMKVNEIVLNPPELKDSITLSKETKKFEDFEDYEYTIKYEKFTLPDISALEETDDPDIKAQQMIYKKAKKSIEKLIWQVMVTVKSKITNKQFSLSTWLYKADEEVTLSP